LTLGGQTYPPSLRANGSRECAPDDRLREAIQRMARQMRGDGLLRRFVPRNDDLRYAETLRSAGSTSIKNKNILGG
jgi:hypothetical protein